MPYNNLPQYFNSAGKITIFTAISGLAIFALVFLLNLGQSEISKIAAQNNATTSVTVLNTPPEWVTGQEAREQIESSVTSPTNSGNEVRWVGTAEDSNGQDYYMIICSASSTPNPTDGGEPTCTGGGFQWAVSSLTPSGDQAIAATTTTEAAPFNESNDWYAYVCDSVTDARCYSVNSTGTNATNSSPFIVNSRPTFTNITNDGPTDPGDTLTFTATAADSDSEGGDDTLRVHVCYQADYSTSTDSCGPGGYIASTTIPGSLTDPTAVANLASIFQDDTYDAFTYVHDNHGHEAIGVYQGTSSPFTVNNVAPTGVAGTVSINGGADLSLSAPADETTGFTLEFETQDANSCLASDGSPEMVDYEVSLYRSGVGSSSCLTGVGGDFDPNNCYNTDVATSTWNITCTASSTSCNHTSTSSDATQLWECEFPLWYIADATDAGSFYAAEDWRVAIGGVDDDGATTTLRTEGTNTVDVLAFTAFDLPDQLIAYGALEPGNDTGTLSASTTIRNEGNTGINQELAGTDMCESATFLGVGCDPNSSTSTIPVNEQEYGTSTLAYGSGFDLATSSNLLAIEVPKSTATSTQTSGEIFWGIAVPGAIALAGDYTGQNTFTVDPSDSTAW